MALFFRWKGARIIERAYQKSTSRTNRKVSFNSDGRSRKQFSIISFCSLYYMRAKWFWEKKNTAPSNQQQYQSPTTMPTTNTKTLPKKNETKLEQQQRRRWRRQTTRLFRAVFSYYCWNVTIVFDWQDVRSLVRGVLQFQEWKRTKQKKYDDID